MQLDAGPPGACMRGQPLPPLAWTSAAACTCHKALALYLTSTVLLSNKFVPLQLLPGR